MRAFMIVVWVLLFVAVFSFMMEKYVNDDLVGALNSISGSAVFEKEGSYSGTVIILATVVFSASIIYLLLRFVSEFVF